MATEKKNALATVSEFHLATTYGGMDEAEIAELQDEMADLDDNNGINCRIIKIPSGGQLAYEVQGDDEGDPEYMKEVSGVIIFTHRMNAYWTNAYGEGDDNTIPACSSMDGKTALFTETGELKSCEGCPLNEYGSDAAGGRGKACKNMRRVYLMMDGDPCLYLLTIPPTSIRDVNKQLARLMANKGVPYTGIIVSFKLVKATNAGGIAYSKATIEKKGLLAPEIAAAAKEMRKQLKSKYTEMTADLSAYQVNPTAAEVEFTEIPESEGEELPFK